MNKKLSQSFSLLPIAAAVVLACSSVYAQDTDEVKGLISPDGTSISVGVGGVNSVKEAGRLGQYTDLNQDAAALVDFEMIRRDEANGVLTKFTGRDLGLETRELGYTREKQGDWKYALDYNEIVRNDPLVIHTGMTGIGTSSPVIKLIQLPIPTGVGTWANANNYTNTAAGVVGSDTQLKVKRTALGISGEKWISPNLQMELSFRNEKKEGARMFGRVGMASGDMQFNATTNGIAGGNGALLLTPEPIDSSIRSIEARLNYNKGSLALTGGYYGSFYVNNFGSLTPVVPSTLNRGLLWNNGINTCTATTGCTVQQLAQSDVALPPDNQAHQFYVDGTYGLSPTTRATFKFSYTHATQNESFAGMGLTPATTATLDLNGVVDTTLAQVGLTMRPTKALSVNASLRYEDRNDKTAVAVYNAVATVPALNNTTNWPSGSQTRTTAKVEGVYRMADGYSVLVGADWERKDSPLPIANTALFKNQVLFRESLDEYGLRASLRKSLSETLNGAVSFEYKERRGDDNGWWTTTGTAGNALLAFDPASAADGNRVLPDMYMDRDRTKLRGNLDWDPTDKFTLQAMVEHGQDDFKRAWNVAPQTVPTIAGARTITNDSLTLDASYKVSDKWRLNGYYTRSENRWNVNKANLGDDTRNTSDTFGFGVKGKINAKLSVGADLLVTQDVTTFNNVVATSTYNGVAGNIAGFAGLTGLPGNYLPNITYNTTKLNLFGLYEIDKKSAVLVNLVYQKFDNDDWQWGYNGIPFQFSDNTTVSNPNQSVTFLGVSYRYKF